MIMSVSWFYYSLVSNMKVINTHNLLIANSRTGGLSSCLLILINTNILWWSLLPHNVTFNSYAFIQTSPHTNEESLRRQINPNKSNPTVFAGGVDCGKKRHLNTQSAGIRFFFLHIFFYFLTLFIIIFSYFHNEIDCLNTFYF